MDLARRQSPLILISATSSARAQIRLPPYWPVGPPGDSWGQSLGWGGRVVLGGGGWGAIYDAPRSKLGQERNWVI